MTKLVALLNSVDVPSNTDVCVAPPYLYLDWLKRELSPSIHVAAQNVSATGHGAYTGEISAQQLADFGIQWTLVGHSERRQLYGATDEVVKKQIQQCAQHKLSIIACIGETDDERKANHTFTVLDTQARSHTSRTARLALVHTAHHHRLRASVGHRHGPDSHRTAGAGSAPITYDSGCQSEWGSRRPTV